MLMARQGITPEQALARLQEQSRQLNRSVHGVAADLVNGWGENASDLDEDRHQPDSAIHLDASPSGRPTQESTVGSSAFSGSVGGLSYNSGDEAWGAHDELLVGLDDRQRRRVRAALSVGRGGTIDRGELEDVIDRTLGRITFEEYLRRGRDRRRS